MKDFTNQIMAIQALVHRQLLHGLRHTEISLGQPKILAYLKSHEGKHQKEIAQACQLEPGSLTVLLKRMEKQGMIQRCCPDGDHRVRSIWLTDYGRALAEQVVERFYLVENLAFSGISSEEEAVFERVCIRMLSNLQQFDPD